MRKKYVIFIIVILIVSLWSFSFYDSYQIASTLPSNIEASLIKNKNRRYYFRIRDSLGISYHDDSKGRYYTRDKLKTMRYTNVPKVLSLGEKYLILGPSNFSMDDGLFYFLPMKYTNIHIYRVGDFQLVKSFRIDQYVEYAFQSGNTLYLVFKDGRYGKLN